MTAKRELFISNSSDVETKKLRKITDNRNSLIPSFEDLPNELYYEIFDYLNAHEIYQSFSNLNNHFEQLITSPKLFLKISLDEKPKHYYRDIINSNKHRLISIHLWNSILVQDFLTQYLINSLFIRLESLILYGITSTKLTSVFPYLKSLSHLSNISIHVDDTISINLIEIYQMILHLPSLKYNSLSINTDDELNPLVPFIITQPFNNLESLLINHACTLNGLIAILNHTPRLNYLSCQSLFETNDNVQIDTLVSLSYLSKFIIEYCSIKFIDFEQFIGKIGSQLKVLHIREFFERNYTCPEQWKQLISQYMPQLSRFTVKCLININDNFKEVHLNTFTDQFNSKFWSEHGWNFRLEIKPDEIFYLIHSTKQSWPMINSAAPQEFGNELSITNSNLIEWCPLFIDNFHSILNVIQIRNLFISCDLIPISTIFKIISLLTNLISLKIISLSLQQLKNLSDEDLKMFRLAMKNNKITKVSQSAHFDLTTFLIMLCPQMEQLEVNWITDSHVEKLVRFILMKTKTDIQRLHSLRLLVLKGDDQITGKLQKMIDEEKLLSDYMIKRYGNDIYLQWKLL